MQLSTERLLQVAKGLTSIINNDRTMSAGARFKLARMYHVLQPELQLIDEQQNAICDKHGGTPATGDNGGVMYTFENGGLEAYKKDWKEVSETKVDVNISPIPLSEFGDECDVSVAEMTMLGDAISE